MNEYTYSCRQCGKEVSLPDNTKTPKCCGNEMELLNVCTTAPSAEFYRPFNEDDPCDDGSHGFRV